MAGSINKVMLIGNVGQAPKIHEFPSGGKVANLSVATSERWKERTSGEMQERTEWHNVVVNQNGASKIIDNFIEPYVRKGSKVYVEGKVQTRKWTDQQGQDRYTTEIRVAGSGSSFELLDSKSITDGMKIDPSPKSSASDDPFADVLDDWGPN